MKRLERAREILDIEIAELQNVRSKLGIEFSRAVQLILESLKCGGKIVVTGVGKNFHIGQKISATLASTGSTSVVLHPFQALHGDLGVFSQKDVLLVLSYSGESEEMTTILRVVRRQGGKIIIMTGSPESSLAKYSDEIIPISITREACPFNLAPTASTTATLAIGDALAVVLLEECGFKKEDFAKLHPGGTIGRTLLLRVSDIMRKGEKLACVRMEATVKDAILTMTNARAGSVGIVDAQNKVMGIFTDGDLRRLVGRGKNISDECVANVMTPHPVTAKSDALAVDILKIYENHNIDDLLVTDNENRLVGIVDIQDLPKFKIF